MLNNNSLVTMTELKSLVTSGYLDAKITMPSDSNKAVTKSECETYVSVAALPPYSTYTNERCPRYQDIIPAHECGGYSKTWDFASTDATYVKYKVVKYTNNIGNFNMSWSWTASYSGSLNMTITVAVINGSTGEVRTELEQETYELFGTSGNGSFANTQPTSRFTNDYLRIGVAFFTTNNTTFNSASFTMSFTCPSIHDCGVQGTHYLPFCAGTEAGRWVYAGTSSRTLTLTMNFRNDTGVISPAETQTYYVAIEYNGTVLNNNTWTVNSNSWLNNQTLTASYTYDNTNPWVFVRMYNANTCN